LSDVTYEVDASLIKKADKKNLILRGIKIFLLEITLLLTITRLLGPLVIIPFIIGVFTVLPSPVPITPNSYQIERSRIIFDSNRSIKINHFNKVKLYSQKKYVSILNRFNWEFLRLYSPEPEKVFKIIKYLIHSSDSSS